MKEKYPLLHKYTLTLRMSILLMLYFYLFSQVKLCKHY